MYVNKRLSEARKRLPPEVDELIKAIGNNSSIHIPYLFFFRLVLTILYSHHPFVCLLKYLYADSKFECYALEKKTNKNMCTVFEIQATRM